MSERYVEKIEKVYNDTVRIETEGNESRLPEVIRSYLQIVTDEKIKGGSFELLKIKENCIYRLCKIYAQTGKVNLLHEINRLVRPLFEHFPKVTTAKITRVILEKMNEIPNTSQEQIKLCIDSIDWAKKEKRSFLRQRIQAKLAGLYYLLRDFENALGIVKGLTREVRRIDDKSLLVEIYLLESKIQYSLKNVPKAKSSLVAARQAGDKIYIPPLLQGDLDTQSGITYSEEGDFKTSFSYFFEGFEGYHNMGKKSAVLNLKYMLMCKIMVGHSGEIMNILSNKNTMEYAAEREIEAMKAVAKAHQHKSLHEFEDALRDFKGELVEDMIVSTHIDDLYEQLLEDHLLRIIKPFSRVQITHIAKLIRLDRGKVERKLSLMILDKKLSGILDQGNDCLITFDEVDQDEVLDTSLKTVKEMKTVVDSLFDRAKKLEEDQ